MAGNQAKERGRNNVGRDLRRVALLIPAFEPDEQLTALLVRLLPFGFGCILLVDDGSSPASATVLAEAAAHPGVEVLRHDRNRGKGRALKTGMAALLERQPSLLGLITADADGQHTADDIVRVAEALVSHRDSFILGARGRVALEGTGAAAPTVPLRSALGNRLTRTLCRWLYGINLQDTQSGLRGFTRELAAELLRIPGERYEFETAMLIELARGGIRPLEVPVSTVYLEGNRRTHFRLLQDSLRVYAALLRPKLSHGTRYAMHTAGRPVSAAQAEKGVR